LNAGDAFQTGTGEYGGQVNNDQQSFFDYNLRQKLGYNPAGTDFVDINQYDPNLFQFDVCSLQTNLLDSGQSYVSYWATTTQVKKFVATPTSTNTSTNLMKTATTNVL